MIAQNPLAPFHEDAILHDRLKQLIPTEHALTKITERIEKHHEHFHKVTDDWYWERHEFGSPHAASRYKARPYNTWEGLMDIQQLGHVLATRSTAAIAVAENFTSYAIGKGFKFKVKVKAKYKENTATKQQAERAQEIIDDFLAENCWADVQEEELLRRAIPTGEVIRQYAPFEGKLDWAFSDAHELRPPDGDAWKRQGPPPPFGIEYRAVGGGPNVKYPTYYWIDNTRTPASQVQHLRTGGDSRDPRSVGMLWMDYVNCREIDEIDYAATQSCLAFAGNAIWYDYNNDVTIDEIDEIAKKSAEKEEKAKALGHLNAGGSVTHALGFTVEGLANNWSAQGFIELIDFKARRLGMIASESDTISSGRTDTGGRNTVIAAESPLIRRVERVANRIGKFDAEFLYQVVAQGMNRWGDGAWLADFRKRIKIDFKTQVPDGRDVVAREESVFRKVELGLMDEITAMEALHLDPDEYLERKEKWAKAKSEMEERLRDDHALNASYHAEELRTRVDTAARLKATGMGHQEAMERAGLDEIEDEEAFEQAVQMQAQAMQSRQNPNQPNDGREITENPGNDGAADA